MLLYSQRLLTLMRLGTMEVSGSLFTDLSFLPLILILLCTFTTMPKHLSMWTTNEMKILKEKFKHFHVGTLFINGISGLTLKLRLLMQKHIQEKDASMNGKPRRFLGFASVCHITTPKSLIGGGADGLRPLGVIIMV